ncbi:MAG: hypothetical protein ACXWZS_09810 [Gemmatirosa sp.]
MTARHALLRTALASAALALTAACGGRESATADSAAAAASPDSAGLQTTPPQPQGPMNMVDSGTKAPTTGDTARRDSVPRP